MFAEKNSTNANSSTANTALAAQFQLAFNELPEVSDK